MKMNESWYSLSCVLTIVTKLRREGWNESRRLHDAKKYEDLREGGGDWKL